MRTMSDTELSYPVKSVSELSENAALLYSIRPGRLDRDWLEPKASRVYIHPTSETHVPSEALETALCELEEAGLLKRSEYSDQFSWVALHPHYTVASGRGSSLIKVSTADSFDSSGLLLAVLVGGDVEMSSSSDFPSWTVRARHENATDEEHDAASTALFRVNAPSVTNMAYGYMKFVGYMVEAKLYPLGVDASQVIDSAGGSPEMCEASYCEIPHWFAPYLPPDVDFGGVQLVQVEVWPIRPYLFQESPYA